MGTRFMDEVEQFGEELAKDVFGAKTADLRPLSGHVADMIFVACFSKPGDVLMCVAPEDGGYPRLWHEGLAGLFGLRTVPLPFLKDNMTIDVRKAEEAIMRVKPKLVIFGASLITFPHPVKELASIANEIDACVGFDGSHVLGLIAGKHFQDPVARRRARLVWFYA